MNSSKAALETDMKELNCSAEGESGEKGASSTSTMANTSSTARRKRRTKNLKITMSEEKISSEGNENEPKQRNMQSYLQPWLQPYVVHYHDDFFLSPYFDPNLLIELMHEGFLPIATKSNSSNSSNSGGKPEFYLLPKLHAERCVLYLSNIRVPKSARKKSKHFVLKCNSHFDGVVHGCHLQHGVAWLYPPMVQSLRFMNQSFKNDKVKVFSIELYRKNIENKELELVAGELGYTVNNQVYTSLTGFYNLSGSGTIQLLALGGFLKLAQVKLWDLGMEMEYKSSLGATCLQRDYFLKEFYNYRDSVHQEVNNISLDQIIQRNGGVFEAKYLIDLVNQ